MKYIKPLPISEEMLGAYLEGNLSSAEVAKVEEIMNLDKEFRDFVDEVSVADPDIKESIYDTYPNFDMEFELPELPLTFDLHPNPDGQIPMFEMDDVNVATCAFSGSDDNSILGETGDDANANASGDSNGLNGDMECADDNIEL